MFIQSAEMEESHGRIVNRKQKNARVFHLQNHKRTNMRKMRIMLSKRAKKIQFAQIERWQFRQRIATLIYQIGSIIQIVCEIFVASVLKRTWFAIDFRSACGKWWQWAGRLHVFRCWYVFDFVRFCGDTCNWPISLQLKFATWKIIRTA